MSKVINLVMGDWSSDGHGKTETVSIKSNLDKEEIKAAYKAGTKILGFDFINEVCADYGCHHRLPQENFETLVKHGMRRDNWDMYDENTISMWTDSFSEIYLFIVKLGNPEFEYKTVKAATIDIGGYGLFD